MKSLVRVLTKKKLKISFVESCTGGLLASSITSISGASKIFSLGLVTYSNQAKIKFLKVNKNIIRNNKGEEKIWIENYNDTFNLGFKVDLKKINIDF